MPILVILAVCTGLFLLFPKGFKFMVATWVGVAGGGLLWGLLAMAIPALITGWTFLGFILAGIFAGCVIAAKG